MSHWYAACFNLPLTPNSDLAPVTGVMARERFLEKFRVEECEAQSERLYHELLVDPGKSAQL